MDKVFFDTETTGLRPGQICQLAYIKQYEDGKIETNNYYFTVDYVTRGAVDVTGRDANFYARASGGDKFKDRAHEINNIFNNSMLIAHNIEFDLNFTSIEMFRAKEEFNVASKFDTMAYFRDIMKLPNKYNSNTYKNPKLIELVEYLKLDKEKIALYSEELFNLKSGAFHDAMYDTTSMFVAFNVYSEQLNRAPGYWCNSFIK